MEMSISREDWSLHRKGYTDQVRHQEKIKEAIRARLRDLIHDESIILSNGKKYVKIPVHTLDEIRFRYNEQKREHVGQGDGKAQPGDVLGSFGDDSEHAAGKGTAGDMPGTDIEEVAVSLEDIEETLFKGWSLPHLERKEKSIEKSVTDRFNDVRKKGLMSNLDKKRTILNALRRSGPALRKTSFHIQPDDLRFKTWQQETREETQAVIMAMMDTSGSMGKYEKEMARVFFFWMQRFLKRNYQHAEIVYIAHHTEAKEVSEEHFFSRGESGGTMVSSAYRFALDLIETRYPQHRFNIYPFHFTDGDNVTKDNMTALSLLTELVKRANLTGYAEVSPYARKSSLWQTLEKINNPRFKQVLVRDKTDILPALESLFVSHES
ncbi:MAG: sporulation protein YhbH [Candidatus Carbobacillus sp.]|nr:sporulation protein YhbH [Candidatus Carbobacillus sp.]